MSEALEQTLSPERPQRWMSLLLSLITLAAWAPTLATTKWTADDPQVVLQSPVVNRSLPISSAFTQDYTFHVGSSGQWRPLAALSLRLDHWLYSPSSSRGWHLSNLLIHLATVLLLANLASKVPQRAPTYGIAFYAIHPTLADSVAWVSGRPSLVCALLGTLGCHLLWKAMRAERGKVLIPAAAAISLGMPLLAKEDGILFALPLLLLAHSNSLRSLKRAAIGLGLGATSWLLARSAALGALLPAATQPILGDAPLYERALVGFKVMAETFRLTLSPVGRPPSYELDSLPGFTGATAIIVLTAGVLWWAHRSERLTPLKLALPLLALTPFLQVIPLGEPFAPRFAHLFTLFLIPLADDLLRRLTSPLPLAILLTLAGTTWQTAQDYRDAESYWLASLHSAPSSPVAWNALGLARAESGRHEEAISAYRAAITQDASHSKAWSNLARSLLAIGRSEEAETALKAAIQAGPRNPIAHANWGLHLERRGDHRGAREAFIRATQLRPGMPQAWAGVARTERVLGREQEAREAEKRLRSLGIRPDK